ncbi:MAG: hypothetical protein DRN40_02610 [Thermoplasmata archaeon]|nr:MAG: hypothetical protein DRN40_02610 [Thermoplasmata archaeon]
MSNVEEGSRVLLTCNYSLTVGRVKRVLERAGIDYYLLVASSGGINVWCSAAGGHLTNHRLSQAPSKCIQSGACIVQCPVDVLSFKGAGGGWLPRRV